MKPMFSSASLRRITGSVLLCLAMFLPFQPRAVAQAGSGDTEVVLSLPAGNQPEGIAVHPTGNVFVGNRLIGGPMTINVILRIAADGTTRVFATLPESSHGTPGLLGLSVDPVGNVYAALASVDPATRGVYRVSRDGTVIDRLPGSEEIAFPNALTFDHRGNLYVSDSTGAIWRSQRGEAFEKWLEDPLLAPLPSDPFGVPLPGANGIAFYPPDTLYVANTEQSLIARVRIVPGGSAGAIEAVTPAFAVPAVDGIAVGALGQVYAVLPGFSLFGTSPLVRIDATTGAVTAVVTDPVDASKFDTPLSVAFAGGRWGVETVLVTNGDPPVAPGGPGPGVVQVEVDVSGLLVR